jgi:hypothetical protein
MCDIKRFNLANGIYMYPPLVTMFSLRLQLAWYTKEVRAYLNT